MSLGITIIAYQFIKHEVGRIDIFHFGLIIENDKGYTPCRYSFQFITHMVFEGGKGFSHGIKTLGYFKGMKKVMGTCLMSTTLGFSPSFVLKYI